MKTLFKKLRKGFTIVELVIVIAVIAILAAVLIPTLANVINSAEESVDMQTVVHLNTILSSYETVGDKAEDLNEAIEQVGENGYDVAKLTPTSEGDILWESESNRFLLVNSKGEIVYKDSTTSLDTVSTTSLNSTLYKIINSESDVVAIYNCVASSNFTLTSTTLAVTNSGIDLSSVSTPVNISYTSNNETAATVNITGNGGTVTINDENQINEINLYGTYSSVNATSVANQSLHIYGTVTGNITIDAGRVVIESTATASSVYVTDTTNVKVTISTSAAITIGSSSGSVTVEISEGVTNNNIETIENVDKTTTEKFAGGFGTEASPYLISTAKQFTNIDYISLNYNSYGYNAENRVYYKLTNDIALSTGIAYKDSSHNDVYCFGGNLYYAVFDGDGYTLDATYVNPEYDAAKNYTNETFHYDLFYIFYIMNNSDLKNVTVNMGGNAEGIVVWALNTITFTKVDVTGMIEFWTGNLTAYVGNPFKGVGSTGNLTFTDCTNYATLTSSGDYYNAVFVGWVTDNGGGTNGINVYLTFDNCVNAGNFTGYKAAMFVANSTDNGYKGIQEMTITNCKNNGSIRSTCTSSYSPNFYIAQGSMSGSLTIDGSSYTLSTVPSLNNVYQGPDDTVAITLENNCYVLTASNISGATTYVISVGLYTTLADGTGTGSYFVTLTVNADDFKDGSYTSTLQNLKFMDLTKYYAETSTSSFTYSGDTDSVKAITNGTGYMVLIGGEWYYLVDNPAYCLTNGTASATRITVSVKDSEGTLLSSASMSN